MRRLLISLATALAMCGAPNLAHAGASGDALAGCFVRSANQTDQMDLMLWMFGTIGSHPDVSEYVSMTPAQRDLLTRKAGAVLQRLMTVDCRKETVAALKNEGRASFFQAFKILTQAAMGKLMSHEAVRNSMNVGEVLDPQAVDAVFKEAGVAVGGAEK